MADIEVASAREIIYDYLTANATHITQWYQPFFDHDKAAEVLGVSNVSQLPKPYGVILLGEEVQSSINRAGWFVPIEVWPYFEFEYGYLPVDEAKQELCKLLGGKIINVDGKSYIIEYQGSGRDYYDDGLEAITRRLDFRMPNVR